MEDMNDIDELKQWILTGERPEDDCGLFTSEEMKWLNERGAEAFESLKSYQKVDALRQLLVQRGIS